MGTLQSKTNYINVISKTLYINFDTSRFLFNKCSMLKPHEHSQNLSLGRVVIPPSMRQKMKKRAHVSHLGEQYTISTAREVMVWPRMHTELIETVKRCTTCQEEQRAQQKEPMIIRAITTHQWQTVASDCFELNNKAYVIVVDVYSRYINFACGFLR